MRAVDEERIAARLASLMAMMCVRNTKIEDLNVGQSPVTRIGDWSDVVVLDADGRKIPWTDVSHIDDDQMRDLMRQIVKRRHTFHMKCDDPGFREEIDRWMNVSGK